MAVARVKLHPSRETNIRTLFGANLILGLCNGFYNVIIQPYIAQFVEGLRNAKAIFGAIMTLAALLQTLPMILSSRLSDLVGRKRVYLAGILLYFFGMVLYAISTDLYIVIIALVLYSLSFGVYDPPIQALAAESSTEKKRAASFSLVTLSIFATGLVGPIVIERLAGKVDLRVYFYGLSVGIGILFLYQLVFLKEPLIIEDFSPSILKQFLQSLKAVISSFKLFFINLFYLLVLPVYFLLKRKKKESTFFRNIDTEVSLLRQIFSKKKVVYALLFFMFDSFVWGISLSIFNGSVVLVYNFTERHIAIFQLAFGLSTISFMIPLTTIADKFKKNELLVISELTGSLFITMNIIAYFSSEKLYPIVIGWVGLGASVAFWVPGILSILTDFDPHRRAETYGVVSGLKSLGWLPTSFITGMIIQKLNFLIPFLISLVLLPIDLYLAFKFPINKKEKRLNSSST